MSKVLAGGRKPRVSRKKRILGKEEEAGLDSGCVLGHFPECTSTMWESKAQVKLNIINGKKATRSGHVDKKQPVNQGKKCKISFWPR